MSVVTPEIKSDWDYIQSAFFASTVVTTIGESGNYDLIKFNGRGEVRLSPADWVGKE